MRRIYFSLFLFVFCSFLFCEEPVVEVFSSGDNLGTEELSWLPNALEEKLEANISRYTNFEIVNSSNKKHIIRIQKESESGFYNEDSAIEVGKLTSASHGLFLTVRKIIDKYTVSLNYTDLTSGKIEVSLVSIPVSSIEELYIFNGCTINVLTIDLCESLNISLTPSDRYVLLNGKKDLSDAERDRIIKDDIKRYSEKLNYLNSKIDVVASSYNNKYGRLELEAQRALTEGKLLKAQANEERWLALAEKKRKDEILNMQRSQEQKDKINKMSYFLDFKIKELDILSKASIFKQIYITESIKKTYCEIAQEVENESNDILKEVASEISFKKQEIENRPLNNSETDGQGKITNRAARNREEELLEFEKIRNKQAKKDIEILNSKMKKYEKGILKEIEKNYRKLNGTISSLSSEFIVDFGNYDSERFGWDVYISIESEDRIIFSTFTFLSYEELTGKNPVTNYKGIGFENYNNTVDYYSSLFARNEPCLIFTIDYSVSPLDKRYPSMYKIDFSNFQVFETENVSLHGSNICSIPLTVLNIDKSSCELQMYPSYDLRSSKDLQLEARHFEEQLWGKNNYKK